MSEYVFDQAWERERDRLRGLESIYDGATTRYLAEIGVSEGWRCLEVGCGAGSVALWLADRVGATGHVLATDRDIRFIEGHGRDNLEARTHDILSGAPEQAAFDVVHCRAVIEHLADRDTALRNLITAVRPGGWVVVEDVDFGGPMLGALARYTSPSENAAVVERVVGAVEVVFGAAGADAGFGAKLVGMMAAAGLTDIGGELHAAIVRGGTEQWTRGTVQQLAEPLQRTGLASADDIANFLEFSDQPSSHYAPPCIVTAWGRRPPDGTPGR